MSRRIKIKKIKFLIIIIAFFSCKSINAASYKLKFQDHWGEVKNSILESWTESKVDSSTWKMPGSLDYPHDFFSIHSGRNVLYCWDTYFTNVGLLLVDSFAIYAKNAVDNQFAEIEQIGFVPNASEPWALNRSQTPFLSMMVREVYEAGIADREWLYHAYKMLQQEYHFWTDTSANAIENHNTTVEGLQRFYHHATKEELLQMYGNLMGRFNFSDTIPENQKLSLADNWLAEAESGMDFTPRFHNRCSEFIPLDLNSNLYVYEKNFEWMVEELQLEGEPDWNSLAKNRKALMNKYCWSEERGIYLDYDFVNNKHSKVASVASFYPLWAGIASDEQAEKTKNNLLTVVEYDFGPVICEKTDQKFEYQWDYPAGWSPMYYISVKALDNYGYKRDAKRIAAKYLDVVSKNFIHPLPESYKGKKQGKEFERTRNPGFVYEKYNAVAGTIYDAEYGSREFHGWSYGVFIWCLDYYIQNKYLVKLN